MEGRIHQALPPLSRAIRLAKPAGYIRIFVDEGASLEPLFKSLLTNQKMGNRDFHRDSAYIYKLNQAFDRELTQKTPGLALVDPLTPREMDILVLLATNKTVPEIAAELFVTPNTVRSHIKHIYSKLDVHRRLGAVQKAKDLNLI